MPRSKGKIASNDFSNGDSIEMKKIPSSSFLENNEFERMTENRLRNSGHSLANFLNPPPPPPPPLPEGAYQKSTGSYIPYNVPEPNPNYVYVTDQHAPLQEWRRIGDPIPENMLNQRGIQGAKTWGPEHHNINLANISRFPNEKLNEHLGILGQPITGTREEKTRRLLAAQANPPDISPVSSMKDPMQDIRNKRLNYFSNATSNNTNKNPLAPPSRNFFPSSQIGTYRLGGGSISPQQLTRTRAWGQNNLMKSNASRTSVATLGSRLKNPEQQTPKQTMGSQAMGAAGQFAMAAPAAMSILMMASQMQQQNQYNKQMDMDREQRAKARQWDAALR